MGQITRRVALGATYSDGDSLTTSDFSLINNYVEDKPGPLTTDDIGEIFYNETEGKMKYVGIGQYGSPMIYTL